MKYKLSEIKVVSLDTRTVILLTQFVRLARVREGADLRMQQPDVVRGIFHYAAQIDNPDLIVLFMRIKTSMSLHLRKCRLEQTSSNGYDQAMA